MKVAYLVNQYPQLSHSFIRREIQALEALGVTVERFSIRHPGPQVDPADAAELERTQVVLHTPLWRMVVAVLALAVRHPGAFVNALRAATRLGRRSGRGVWRHGAYLVEACVLTRWLRQRNVSHLHAHFGTNPAAVALLVRLLGGPPYSFTVHGPEEFDRPENLYLDEKLAHSAFAVAISSFGRSQLYRRAPAERWSDIHIVHCGVDATFLDHESTPVPDVPGLVCVGRLCEQKGQVLLLHAVRMLLDQGVAGELTLIGDGPTRPQIESEIARLNLAGSVRLLGAQSGDVVRREILAARALVLPSFAEGLPVVLMEALALARPVVSTYVAGIPELVRPGECGWLVPAGSVVDLADALRAVLQAPPKQLTQGGAAGRRRVVERHDAAIEAGKLVRLFHESNELKAARDFNAARRAVPGPTCRPVLTAP